MIRFLAPLTVAALAAFALEAAHAQPASAQPQPQTPRLDSFGDPLPDAAFARLGTTRFRHGGKELLGFTPDGKALLYLGGGALHLLDATTGKEIKSIRFGEGGPRGGRRFGLESSTALSGDTKVLAVATQLDGGAITVIDTNTGKERKRFGPNDLFKNAQNFFQPSIHLSEDGKLLLVSSGRNGDRLPVVWVDTTTGDRLHELAPNKDCRFGHAQFSRDAKQVVAVEHDDNNGSTKLRVFDTAKGVEIRNLDFQGANNGMWSFQLLPDGKSLVATKEQGGPLRLYDYTGDKQVTDLRGFSDVAPGGSYTLSRDGKQLFITGLGQVHQWDVDGGKEIQQIHAPNLPKDQGGFGPGGRLGMSGLAVSLDGKQLAVSGSQSYAVFDTQTGKQTAGGSGGAAIGVVRFTPDGQGLIVGNSDYRVELWDFKTAKLSRTMDRPEKEGPPRPRGFDFFSMFLGSAQFSADGKILAVSLGEGGVGMWEVSTGKFLKHFGGPDDNKDFGGERMPTSFAFVPRTNTLAIGLASGTIKIFDAGTGLDLRNWTWTSGGGGPGGRMDSVMLSLGFSPDGKTLAGGGMLNVNDGLPQTMVILWETSTGKERLRLRSNVQGFGNDDFGLDMIFLLLDQMALSVNFSPDGKTVAIGSFSGVHVIDAFTGKDIATYSGRMMFGRTATFSPDGKLLFVGRVDGTLRVLDATTGRVVRDFVGHQEPIFSVALSADGKTLATGSNDSTVLVWDVAELTRPLSVAKTTPTAKELEALWQDLGDGDAAKAYQAMNVLSAAPAEAVPFLKDRIQPIPPADPQLVDKLLDDLNNQKFAVREKATAELQKLGDLAAKALGDRLKANPTLEMRQRMEKLVARLNGPVQAPAMLQALRGIETLERIGTPEARQALAAVAKGAAGHRITEDARAAAARMEKLK